MKRFKKVLALVLAGVLALAMLTACDGTTTDPDKIMPDDGTADVMQALQEAANQVSGASQPGDYSAKYSAITRALLVNLIELKNGKINNSTYVENYNKITAGVKVVGGLTDSTVQPSLNSGNPAIKFDGIGSKAEYKDSLIVNNSQYGLSEKVGIAFVKTENSTGLTTTYQLVCLFHE